MAKKKEDLPVLIIALAMLPLLIFTLPFLLGYYLYLKSQHLSSTYSVRVVDTPLRLLELSRWFIRLFKVQLVWFLPFSAFFLYLEYVGKGESFFDEQTATLFLLGGITLICLINLPFLALSSTRLAAFMLCFVVDYDKGKVTFPTDMSRYTATEFLSLKTLFSFGTVDCINLSEIRKYTRSHGVELYMHGDFGSRRVSFSSKQKRDEAMSLLKESNEKIGTIFETENY